MLRIIIQGYATVFQGRVQVTDETILRSLHGLAYEGERFTDYLGGPAIEDDLIAALEPGGILKFSYDNGNDCLTATTEYAAKRRLTDAEVEALVDYTMGQWSDGIGENWTGISGARCGYTVMCIAPGLDPLPLGYPGVRVIDG